jgi:hypothetical protein
MITFRPGKKKDYIRLSEKTTCPDTSVVFSVSIDLLAILASPISFHESRVNLY